jgi:predicted Zn-dependent peptidase
MSPASNAIYQVSRLENGLLVGSAQMPHMTSVSLGFWIGIGSRYEPPSLNGVCHFIEHLVFKGTRHRSAREISQAVEGLGGYLNAFTSEESTCFHARIRHQHLPEVFDVLADMLLEPRFAPVDISREREVIKEEIASYMDEPQHHVQELLNATLWPAQALGQPITGTPESLDRLARRNVLGYLQQNYIAESLAIVAAGNVTHEQLLKLASKYARRFRHGVRPSFDPATNGQQQPNVVLASRDVEQTQVALGIRTCSRHDPRRYALRLLNAILGENMSSRLFQVVREDNGLAYSVYSSPSFFADTGDLVISAGIDPDKVQRAIRLIVRELRRFRDRAPSAAELRRARDYAIGQIELSRENTESQMNWVGEQLLGYGEVLAPSTIERRLCRVTPAAIQAVAKDFFHANHLNLALVGPMKSADHLRRQLAI